MRKPIDRIKGFLERRNALFIDFSEPYVLNYVPTFDIDGHFYYLDRIAFAPDGTTLEFYVTDYHVDIQDIKQIKISQWDVLEEELRGIADWLNNYRQYINRHAQIAKYPEK